MAIYSSIWSGPARNYTISSARKKYICIHNTSNNATAEAEASYATRRSDSVSSHYYVDNNSIVQSIDTRYKAWHAGSSQGNTYGISYEITGTNSKSRQWWLDNVAWDLLAKQIAADMKLWGIANRHLTVDQMRAGSYTGIVTHDDMRRAWGGTTHTDPGSNFPMDYLIAKVNKYLVPEREASEDMTEAQEKLLKDINYILWQGGKSATGERTDFRVEFYKIQDDVEEMKATLAQILEGVNSLRTKPTEPTV